jgi:hypothetical protein
MAAMLIMNCTVTTPRAAPPITAGLQGRTRKEVRGMAAGIHPAQLRGMAAAW